MLTLLTTGHIPSAEEPPYFSATADPREKSEISLSLNYLLAFIDKLYISGTPVGTGSSRGLYEEGNHIPLAGYGSFGIRMPASYVVHRYYHPK
jgi:hypothetical protein